MPMPDSTTSTTPAEAGADHRGRVLGHGRRKLFVLAEIAKAPLAIEAVRRIDAIFDVERDHQWSARRPAPGPAQDRVAPLVADLETWMRAERGKLSRHADVAKAMDYMLKRWDAFTRFLDDGRICLTNNAAERALRGIAKPVSLCTSSSSIWKHWKLTAGGDVTRAPFAPGRLHHRRRIQVRGTDLERRAGDNLLGAKDTRLDQLAEPMTGDAAALRCLAQGQPGAVLLGGLVGVNAADAPDRADPVCRPGLALAGRQAHPVERGRDVLVGPAGGHAPDDRQGVVGGAARVLTRCGVCADAVRSVARPSNE